MDGLQQKHTNFVHIPLLHASSYFHLISIKKTCIKCPFGCALHLAQWNGLKKQIMEKHGTIN